MVCRGNSAAMAPNRALAGTVSYFQSRDNAHALAGVRVGRQSIRLDARANPAPTPASLLATEVAVSGSPHRGEASGTGLAECEGSRAR